MLISLREGQSSAPSLRSELVAFALPVGFTASFLVACLTSQFDYGEPWGQAAFALGLLSSLQLVVQVAGRFWRRFGPDGIVTFTMTFNFRKKPPKGEDAPG
ncbi:hypothetical protein [Saccharothrix texasensis]|uniref:hypothetical protein n=1 Tax=Saccharothrix texasensis TaxID=103734 RepID=UPI0011CDA312|nr:hypothetical protein [Saccharothrix texasensis]